MFIFFEIIQIKMQYPDATALEFSPLIHSYNGKAI